MADKEQLKPDDFPVHTKQNKIVKPDGKDIAEARNPKIAEEVAERLNAEEDRREEDRGRSRSKRGVARKSAEICGLLCPMAEIRLSRIFRVHQIMNKRLWAQIRALRLDRCTVIPYTSWRMKIRKVRHRGLRRFIENDARELRGDLVKRIRNVLAFLSPLRASRAWAHRPVSACTSSRAASPDPGSISVSGNWRITFGIERDEITNLDLEDYH